MLLNSRLLRGLLVIIHQNNCCKEIVYVQNSHFISQVRLLQYVMPDILGIVATPIELMCCKQTKNLSV